MAQNYSSNMAQNYCSNMVKIMVQIRPKIWFKYNQNCGLNMAQTYSSNMVKIMVQIRPKIWFKYDQNCGLNMAQNYSSNMVKIMVQIRPKIWLEPQSLAATLLTLPRQYYIEKKVLHCNLQKMSPESRLQLHLKKLNSTLFSEKVKRKVDYGYCEKWRVETSMN